MWAREERREKLLAFRIFLYIIVYNFYKSIFVAKTLRHIAHEQIIICGISRSTGHKKKVF